MVAERREQRKSGVAHRGKDCQRRWRVVSGHCLGYDEEYEVDGYPYITTIDQLLETIEFTGMIVHDDKKDGKHAIGLFFDATWEEEHGAGVLMAGFDVLDTGNQDHTYYTYALH